MTDEPKITVIKSKSGFELPKIGSKILILISVLILAVISITTAVFMFGRKNEPVAPNAPKKAAAATQPSPTPPAQSVCSLIFMIAASPTPTSTPSSTPTPTPTSTPTPGPAEPNTCGGTCGSNSNCTGGLSCYQGFCRNPDNPSDVNCGGVASTPTPTPVALEKAGSVGGTWTVAISGAVLLILGSLVMFAL